ncbi:hypothetical protein ACWEOZ_29990 [Actinoplanes sp. NPDC004185]
MTREEMEFARWRDSLRVLVVDGEQLFVIHGDRLVDESQLRREWADREGGNHGNPGNEDAGDPQQPDQA